MRTIEIIVDPQGNARLQTKGYAGSECRAGSSELEAALGQSTAEQLTTEFYQARATEDQQERHRQ